MTVPEFLEVRRSEMSELVRLLWCCRIDVFATNSNPRFVVNYVLFELVPTEKFMKTGVHDGLSRIKISQYFKEDGQVKPSLLIYQSGKSDPIDFSDFLDLVEKHAGFLDG